MHNPTPFKIQELYMRADKSNPFLHNNKISNREHIISLNLLPETYSPFKEKEIKSQVTKFQFLHTKNQQISGIHKLANKELDFWGKKNF